jgi:glutamate-1-semialdehyde 2,1-aminomutase
LRERGKKIACMILEPVAGNMGVVPPAPGYLEAVRELTRRHGVVMVLDEVMTGFRVARNCAQGMYEIEPDLTCFGKIIGGGLPAAAYGGRADLMDQMAPTGSIYQAGTLSGNPLAMCAGIETLKLLDEPGAYERLESVAAQLHSGIGAAAERAGVPLTTNRVGSMMTAFFNKDAVTNYATAVASDTEMFAAFFKAMLSRGVFLAPSQFEAAFVSLAHGEAEVRATLEAAGQSFQEIAS